MKLPPPPWINDELIAYGLACAEAMREECAKVCENPDFIQNSTFDGMAAAIRAIEVER